MTYVDPAARRVQRPLGADVRRDLAARCAHWGRGARAAPGQPGARRPTRRL